MSKENREAYALAAMTKDSGGMNEGKYRHITRILRSRILREVYKDRLPGETNLAKELGVSTATLAHALSSLETVGLIRRKWRSGTFVVPKEERAKTFAPMTVVLSSLPDTASSIVGGFGQAAQAHGLDVALIMHSDEAPDSAVDDALLRLRNVTCLGACFVDFPMDSARALRLASAPGTVVLADWETPDLILPTITHDDREAGRMAAAHLLKLGHRRILLVDAILPDPIRTARIDAAAELVRQSGGLCRERVAPDFKWGVPACVEALKEDRPTAVITCAHVTAVHMSLAAASLGLKAPRDLSILCISNIKVLNDSEIFTHVRFDETALGAGALELLLESTPSEGPRRRIIPVRFVDRGTTAPPPSE